MTNLPLEHHRLDTHARHREKALAALLWTARFRWAASRAVDQLLGGNGLLRKLIDRKLLVEHLISNPFSPVRYYATLSIDGLDLLQRQWLAIGRGEHGAIATCLAASWEPPVRSEHRIREARFAHDFEVQMALARAFRFGPPIERVYLADDLERVPLTNRPAKIPDVAIEFRRDDGEAGSTTTTLWGEVELSRKNQREIDLFCAYYRGALAGNAERKFDKLIVLCHESVLTQWRRDFGRTIVPRWQYRKPTRDWIRLDPKDWHRFPELSAAEIEATVKPLHPVV